MENLTQRFESLAQQAAERADELPYVRPLRLFWEDLHATRDWWPILIPALILIGWRTYTVERRRIDETLRRQREHAASVGPPSPTTALAIPTSLTERDYAVSLIVHRKAAPPSARVPWWRRWKRPKSE